jgi:Zn-dependent metalloprotease
LFDGLGVTREFLRDEFERNSLDDRGMRLDGYVHYGLNYNNAVFDGSAMLFGDGNGVQFRDFTYSLDVIAHELGHGVTQFTSNLRYRYQSGALNESFSDVFGSIVKQWSLNQEVNDADWLIGADVWTPNTPGDALRSMKSPGRAYVNHPLYGTDPQPAHMNDFVQTQSDNQGVHYNSGIPNKAFYETAVRIGGNAWELPGHIWYDALRAANQDTEFQEFADLTYTAAAPFGSDAQRAVFEGWREVGIRISGVTAATARRRSSKGGQNAVTLADVMKELDRINKRIDALSGA